eukprot:3019158-Rhodomonas_salina.1
MGLKVREEVTDEVSGYSLDIVLDTTSPLAPHHVGKCKAGWAVEVDGPWHFVRSSDGRLHCNGGTLLKRRHLEGLGYALVTVPFWEWDAVEKQQPEEQVASSSALSRRLHGAMSAADAVKYLSEKLALRRVSTSGGLGVDERAADVDGKVDERGTEVDGKVREGEVHVQRSTRRKRKTRARR